MNHFYSAAAVEEKEAASENSAGLSLTPKCRNKENRVESSMPWIQDWEDSREWGKEKAASLWPFPDAKAQKASDLSQWIRVTLTLRKKNKTKKASAHAGPAICNYLQSLKICVWEREPSSWVSALKNYIIGVCFKVAL